MKKVFAGVALILSLGLHARSESRQCVTVFTEASRAKAAVEQFREALSSLDEGAYVAVDGETGKQVRLYLSEAKWEEKYPGSLFGVVKIGVHEEKWMGRPSGKVVAQSTFRYIAATRTLALGRMDVEFDFSEQGLSRLLLAAVVARFPEIETVEAKLLDTNYSLFIREFEKNGGDVISALRVTPAFKISRSLGFTEIDVGRSSHQPSSEAGLQLVVHRKKMSH